MGHSIQLYRGKHEKFKDLDLLAFLGLALQIINESVEFESLQDLAHQWRYTIDGYGTGVIPLKVEELARSPDQRQALFKLLEKVKLRALQYNDLIPADTLNKLVSNTGVRFFDFKVSFVVETVNKLQNLYSLNG
jgi:hypothetical protein